MFKIMYKNEWTGEYEVETVKFISRRLMNKVWRDAFDGMDRTAQDRAVEGMFTRWGWFRRRTGLRILG
jgi:hypothetical protein